MKEEKEPSSRPCGREDGSGRAAASSQPAPRAGGASWGLRDEPWMTWIECILLLSFTGASQQVHTMQSSPHVGQVSHGIMPYVEAFHEEPPKNPIAADLTSNTPSLVTSLRLKEGARITGIT